MTLLQACDLAEFAWNISDVWDQKTDTHVAFKQDGTTLYVCFRGSEFADAYDSVEDRIEAKISEVNPLTVVYVGHSLGAILAVLGSIASLLRGRRSPAFGIGCPRGISFFSVLKIRRAMSGLITWWRNDQDVITHLAPKLFWATHIGKKVQVGKWWRFWTAILPNATMLICFHNTEKMEA